MKIKVLLAVLALTMEVFSYGQTNNVIDSLENVIKTAREDTTKVNILNTLSWQYINVSNFDRAKLFIDQALELAEDIQYKQGIAQAYNNAGLNYLSQYNYIEAGKYFLISLNHYDSIGNKKAMADVYSSMAEVFSNQDNYPKALEFNNAALKIARELGDNVHIIECLLRKAGILVVQGNPLEVLNDVKGSLRLSEEIGYIQGIVQCKNRLGNLERAQGNFQEAFEHYLSALPIEEENGFKKEMANTYFGISMIYQNQGNYPEALNNLKVSLNIKEEIGDKQDNPLILRQFGNIYLQTGNIPEALKNYLAALAILQERGIRRGTAALYHNIGMIYESQGNYTKAEENYILATKIREEAGIGNGIMEAKIFLGNLYIKQKRFEEARKQFEELLELSKNRYKKGDIMRIHNGLSSLDSAEGDYKHALEHYKISIVYKDSIFNEKSSMQLSQLEVQFETENKDREIELLNKDKKLQEQQIQKQRLVRNGILAGVVLLVLVGLLLFRSFRLRKKLERQQAIAQERNRISADLHDDIGSGLSEISLLSEIVTKESNAPKAKTAATKIAFTSKHLLESMSEIIWALNSKNDYLESLVAYIRRYAAEYFENAPVKLKIRTPVSIAHIPINAERRRNIFYAVKEALHNIIKHSQATEAELIFTFVNDELSVVVRDNGIGFTNGEMSGMGNGMNNMLNRMKSINGDFSAENHEGTKITLTLRMQ